MLQRLGSALMVGVAALALGCVERPNELPPLEAPKVCLASPVTAAPSAVGLSPEDGEGPAGRFKVGPEHFAVWDGTRYRDLFVRAMNLGASQPGNGPNDLTATYADYRCWFQLLSTAGINAVRLYVPHFPVFYAALADHNQASAERPLYLLQGAYLPEAPEESTELDLYQHGPAFDSMLTTLVDIVHGRAKVDMQPRGAFGTYDVDVSAWTLAWLPGREVLAREATATNARHREDRSFEGKRLRIPKANPTEVFMAARLDHLVDYELREYGSGRPFAWSNWLELDPLEHPTESSRSPSDVESVDFAKLIAFDAPAGHFVSYHAYPYYPDFINDDPKYRLFADDEGPNSYLGLLEELRNHHRGQALFIAEFGVPTSIGRAHTSSSGMHHGSLSEEEQGRFGARMARNIAAVGAAGFAYFQLTDGWWKRIWILAEQTFPHERLRYWHDMLNAQQHYGLIAFDQDPPDWSRGQVASGDERIRELRVRYDAEFVHLRVDLREELEATESLVIGFDTYSHARGESKLPNGVRTKQRSEFALTVQSSGHAEVQAQRSYDLRYILLADPPPEAEYHSTRSDAGDWIPIEWRIARARMSDDGRYSFPDDIFPIGVLRVEDPAAPSSLDVVKIDGRRISIEIPWSLLNFAEPPRRIVIDDDRSTPEREVAETAGIAFAVSVGTSLLETPRIGWERWFEPPQTHERLKAGAPRFFEALTELPTWFDSTSGDPSRD